MRPRLQHCNAVLQHWSHPTVDSGLGGEEMAKTGQDGQWGLLAYRLPRIPSTPRSTIWRKLKRLGVAQISDGLVALPAAARTREALERTADAGPEHYGES